MIEIDQPLNSTSASLGRRLAAYAVDVVPIVLLVFGYFYLFHPGFAEAVSAYFQNSRDLQTRVRFLDQRNQVRDLSFVLWLIYSTVMESSEWQGTFGKKVMGIRVVGPACERLSMRRAAGRSLAKILSFLPLGLGFLWALFSHRKAWHDTLAGTAVIRDA